jgi:hypothetical protein
MFVPVTAIADEPGLKAELTCRPEAAPGRVLCELKYSVDAGARLVWADALVTSSPDFARPLRSRVTPERFGQAGGGGTERKLSLAFVATKLGVGEVMVRARAVVCQGAGQQERCRPRVEDVRAELRVGG